MKTTMACMNMPFSKIELRRNADGHHRMILGRETPAALPPPWEPVQEWVPVDPAGHSYSWPAGSLLLRFLRRLFTEAGRQARPWV